MSLRVRLRANTFQQYNSDGLLGFAGLIHTKIKDCIQFLSTATYG